MMKPSRRDPRVRIYRKRTHVEIILRILESARGEILPSNLLTKANLNTARMEKYTELLIEKGLLIRKTITYGKNKKSEVFVTSLKGMEYISVLKEFEEATKKLVNLPKK